MHRLIVAPIGMEVHYDVASGAPRARDYPGHEPSATVTSVWIGGHQFLREKINADDLTGIEEALDGSLAGEEEA